MTKWHRRLALRSVMAEGCASIATTISHTAIFGFPRSDLALTLFAHRPWGSLSSRKGPPTKPSDSLLCEQAVMEAEPRTILRVRARVVWQAAKARVGADVLRGRVDDVDRFPGGVSCTQRGGNGKRTLSNASFTRGTVMMRPLPASQ